MTNKTLRKAPGYIFLVIFSLFSLFPLYFMLVSATNTSRDVLAARMLPGGAFMENWTNLTANHGLWPAVMHSTINAVITTVLALIISAIVWGFGANSSNPHLASRGKVGVLVSCGAAIICGASVTLINFFWGVGQAV